MGRTLILLLNLKNELTVLFLKQFNTYLKIQQTIKLIFLKKKKKKFDSFLFFII